MGLFVDFIMLHNIKPLSLHRVFHGIRFKVNKDWDSAESLFYFYPIPKHRFPPSPTTIRIAKVSPEHGIEAPAHWEVFGEGSPISSCFCTGESRTF